MPPLIQGLATHCSLALALLAGGHAQSPPSSFSRNISTSSQTVSVNFTLHPIRSANFQTLVQQANGTYATYPADAPRTYLGTVTGHPGATAIGLLRANGTLLARISFEDGKTWTSTGGTANASGNNYTPAWPTSLAPTGGAGSVVYAAEVGIDSTFNHFTACGSSVDAVIEQSEFSVMSTNMVYLREAAILHRIGKIIVRADASQDPYSADGNSSNALLPHIRSLWNTGVPMGHTHDAAMVVHSNLNGGLAYVGTIATSSRYSANDSDANGDFSVVWRHEVGHNWGSSHYEGGGNPEGPTIMSNNSLSRFSSSELLKIINHRNSKQSNLDALPSYPFPIPPRANQDAITFFRNSPTRIDAVLNDSDSNGEPISLHSFDTRSVLGGTLTRSLGSGPSGRDEIIYTPPPGLASGTDSFNYRIQDSSGMQALGHVMLRPRAEILKLADQWLLDETSGDIAINRVRSSHNASHQNSTLVNQTGANAVTRKAVYFDGSDDRSSIPAPAYNTNTLTFTAWIRRNGTQNPSAAILFTRAGSSIAGLHFGSNNELRHTWNNSNHTWDSGIVPPDNTWCLVAMCVSPNGTSLHLRTPNGMQSASLSTPQAAEAFDGALYLGWDPNTSTRHFKGWIDEVRVYQATLNAADIESLYQQANNPPDINLTLPTATTAVSPINLSFSASVTSMNELLDTVDFVENGVTLASATTPPFQALVPAIAPGSHTVTARASFGDWGYQIESPPLTFTTLPAPLPTLTLTASLPASKRGPSTGTFTITRDHSIGDLTVPLSISGTAIPGVDYQALPGSITLKSGSLTHSITVTPIAATPDQISEHITISLATSSNHTLGAPSSATLIIDDHITSITPGEWDQATTWNSGAPAPGSGTQNSGIGYAIAHKITSNDPGSNTQALIAGSLRVKNHGILDLARLHNTTLQSPTYNLPSTTLEDGASMHFRCSSGSCTHNVPASITAIGNTTLLLTGGTYANSSAISGKFSGSGTVAILSDTNASNGTYVRQISINSANNTFSGNWTINHTATGDDFAVLRAGASNALGTGNITIGDRSQVITDNPSGLNSIRSITLNGTDATLKLNQAWTNTTARLVLSSATCIVEIGNAASTIGQLSGSGGIIQGGGAASSLTVNSNTSSSFAGSFTGSLGFTKSGPASLTLTGNHLHTGTTHIRTGILQIGSRGTTGSLGNSPIIIDNPATLHTFRSDTTCTIASPISGAGTLLFEGSSELSSSSYSLTGDNSEFSGTAIAKAARINIDKPDTDLGTATLKILSGGQLYLQSATSFANNTEIAGTGWPEESGSLGAIRLQAGATATGTITLSANSQITAHGSTGTLGGNLAETAPHSLDLRNTSSTANSTFTLSNSSSRHGNTSITGAIVLARHQDAFGSGTLTLQSNGTTNRQTRLELHTSNLGNDILLSSNAQTNYLGLITAADEATSTLSGTLTITSSVGNGGHFASSGSNSILRITGTINTTGTIPNIRSGTVELGTTDGNLTQLSHGQGLLRLIAPNGIQPGIWLNMAASSDSTLDLNGHNQTLSRLSRPSSHAATVTNSSSSPATLTLATTTANTFSGDITSLIHLVKSGTATLTLSGDNTYLGNTMITAGSLELTKPGLTDTSSVYLSTGSTLILSHNLPDTIDKLFIDNIQQVAATYNSSSTPLISGGGSLVVTSTPVPKLPFDAWALQIPNPGLRARTADADQDGFSNLHEFLFGTSPTTANHSLVQTVNSAEQLILHWIQRDDDATYQLTQSHTLSPPWAPSPAIPTAAVDQSGVLSGHTRFSASIPTNQKMIFLRIEASE